MFIVSFITIVTLLVHAKPQIPSNTTLESCIVFLKTKAFLSFQIIQQAIPNMNPQSQFHWTSNAKSNYSQTHPKKRANQYVIG